MRYSEIIYNEHKLRKNTLKKKKTNHISNKRSVIAVSEGPEGQGSKGEHCCSSINGEQRKIHIHSMIFKGDHWRFL